MSRLERPCWSVRNALSIRQFAKSEIFGACLLEQFKALSNDVRLQILEWLKEPAENFPPTHAPNGWVEGVCVTHIQQKAGLSPSTASTHLAVLQRAGLVQSSRVGGWTYYRRNEEAIAAFAKRVGRDL